MLVPVTVMLTSLPRAIDSLSTGYKSDIETRLFKQIRLSELV